MGRKINLSHLSEGECRQILDVIQRDFTIRQREKERLVKLQKLVKDEEQKRLVLSRQKQFNEKYCICCFSSFGLIFNKRTECKSCGFYVCRDCWIRPEGLKVIMCLGCVQQRELQVQVCEWFYGQIRNRFRRFGSAKIVRSLYKRDSQTSDSVDQTSTDSGVDHQLSPPARGDVPSSDEAARVFLETLEKQTNTDPDDWLPLFKPEMSSVAVQAPEDVLPEVMSSRKALEDFVFNLPPEEEELVAAVEAQITALQQTREGAMNMAGLGQSGGQLSTVSVALCDLSSPGVHDPFAFHYGSVIQIQIPCEYVDTPFSVLNKFPEQAVTENNNNNNERELTEIEFGLGVPVVTGNNQKDLGEERLPFAIESCEVSVEFAPINAIIIRYLEEGDDASLWPDYRLSRRRHKFRAKHASNDCMMTGEEKRQKLDMGATDSSHGNEVNLQANERYISTLELALGNYEDLPEIIPDHQHEVQLAVSDLEQLSQA